jgi:putative two-component system response regulator
LEKEQSILIVDDAPEMIEILGNILKEYKLKVAINGKRALKIALSENPPDLILLDIMPDIDGYEVCKIIKNDEKTKNIQVIFTTALSDNDEIIKGLNLGASDFIHKPFQPDLVRARVKNYLCIKLLQDKINSLI